jgi:aspartyl/glutamyl-tRNA(Asn/Gln) amidotransferase C subunit
MTNVNIDKLARLSQLQLSAEEARALQKDCEQMVRFTQDLQMVDTQGVKPLATVPEEMALRDDIKRASPSQSGDAPAAVLGASKETLHDCFAVPKVLGASPKPSPSSKTQKHLGV